MRSAGDQGRADVISWTVSLCVTLSMSAANQLQTGAQGGTGSLPNVHVTLASLSPLAVSFHTPARACFVSMHDPSGVKNGAAAKLCAKNAILIR